MCHLLFAARDRWQGRASGFSGTHKVYRPKANPVPLFAGDDDEEAWENRKEDEHVVLETDPTGGSSLPIVRCEVQSQPLVESPA